MPETDERHGITGPVSLKESSAAAATNSKHLAGYLEASGFFESEESAQTRERVLGKLDFLVKKFVKSLAPPGNTDFGGKIFTFGSYRLGVHDRGADIDALCVVPRHVRRSDFFTAFYDQLKTDPNISELSRVEEAYVPLIKMKFHEIPIDLTFSRLNIPVVKESVNLLNDSILRGMDEKCVLSLNGSRATDVMLRLVPNTKVFHGALRAVKFWAQRRFIYGASYGYFGGIAFSICVARICQMYPNFCSYDILHRFFEAFSSWKWPTPVMLRQVPDLNYNMKVWDPKVYPSDRYHKMPVITPVYPQKCATHNVTQSTASFITSEFARAHKLFQEFRTQCQDRATEEELFAFFSKLTEFSDFFKKNKLFLEIVATAESESGFLLWKGFIESKVRVLALKLEGVENVAAAVPFANVFVRKKEGNEEEGAKRVKGDLDSTCSSVLYEARIFIAICVDHSKKTEGRLYVDGPIREYLSFVNEWEKREEGMRVEVNARKRREVQEFLRSCGEE